MRKLRSLLALPLAFCLLLSMSIGFSAAGAADEFTVRMTTKVEEFFGGQKSAYRFFDNQLNDITQQFYQQYLNDFQSGNIDAILDYIKTDIRRIEKDTIQSVSTRAAGDVTINIRREFSEKLESLASSEFSAKAFYTWIDGAMLASYVSNKNFGIITSATKPTLESTVRFYDYGPNIFGVPQLVSVTSKNPTFSSDSTRVTFQIVLNCRVAEASSGAFYANYPALTISGTYSY